MRGVCSYKTQSHCFALGVCLTLMLVVANLANTGTHLRVLSERFLIVLYCIVLVIDHT